MHDWLIETGEGQTRTSQGGIGAGANIAHVGGFNHIIARPVLFLELRTPTETFWLPTRTTKQMR